MSINKLLRLLFCTVTLSTCLNLSASYERTHVNGDWEHALHKALTGLTDRRVAEVLSIDSVMEQVDPYVTSSDTLVLMINLANFFPCGTITVMTPSSNTKLQIVLDRKSVSTGIELKIITYSIYFSDYLPSSCWDVYEIADLYVKNWSFPIPDFLMNESYARDHCSTDAIRVIRRHEDTFTIERYRIWPQSNSR